jgi:hypothetical protein
MFLRSDVFGVFELQAALVFVLAHEALKETTLKETH